MPCTKCARIIRTTITRGQRVIIRTNETQRKGVGQLVVTTNTNEGDNARERRAGERYVRSHLWRMEQARERVQESRVAFYSEKWGEVRDYTSPSYIEARKRAASSPSNSVLSLVLFLPCLYTRTAVSIRARGHLPRNFPLLSRRGRIYLCSC